MPWSAAGLLGIQELVMVIRVAVCLRGLEPAQRRHQLGDARIQHIALSLHRRELGGVAWAEQHRRLFPAVEGEAVRNRRRLGHRIS